MPNNLYHECLKKRAQSTKNTPPRNFVSNVAKSSLICEHMGSYTHPTVAQTFNAHWQCTGSNSSAPPWEAPFLSIFNNSTVPFTDYLTGSVGAGRWGWYWDWKDDSGKEEWTNGSQTFTRTFWQEHTAYISTKEITGEGNGDPG